MAADRPAHWEHFEHEADIGVRGIGSSMAEAFAQAALAVTALITDPGAIKPEQNVRIELQEPDPELMLTDWLNAVIFEMATRRILFARFDVSIDGPRLVATLHGEPIDAAKHQPAVEVKGAAA